MLPPRIIGLVCGMGLEGSGAEVIALLAAHWGGVAWGACFIFGIHLSLWS